MKIPLVPALLAALVPATSLAAPATLAIKATNSLPIARSSETIVLAGDKLAPLGEKSLDKIHIKDAGGNELLVQTVDLEGDGAFDQVIFQSDFGPKEAKEFTASAGKKQAYAAARFKAYGRFVRERFDDFAWENDRIAQRTYGKALENWKAEPLTSSTIDIWSKRVPRMVINDWYMTGTYHDDSGEGADFYSAGKSRGNGGNGLWAVDRLWTSKNFVNSRVIAAGPIRVQFELEYEPFDVNGTQVAESKRITLDAGSNLGHYVSTYKPSAGGSLTMGIGVKKADLLEKDMDAARGTFTTWETVKADRKGASRWGQAIIVEPGRFEKLTEDELNMLVLAKVPPDNVGDYWAGFCWDQSGQFADYAAWKSYVSQFAQRLASPITVSVAAK